MITEQPLMFGDIAPIATSQDVPVAKGRRTVAIPEASDAPTNTTGQQPIAMRPEPSWTADGLRERSVPVAGIWIGTNLEVFEATTPPVADAVIVGGVEYRKLTPEWLAHLWRLCQRATSAYDAGRMGREQWLAVRERWSEIMNMSTTWRTS